MSDQAIMCHFKFGEENGCGKATGFVRVPSGRLCPLCDKCKERFKASLESVKARTPDTALAGDCVDVSLEDGAAEYAAQPPKAKT